MASSNPTPTIPQLSDAVAAMGLPVPSANFLHPILQPRPVHALAATVKHRLLNSNLTQPDLLADSNGAFPSDVSNVAVKEVTLQRDICVQVLDVEDIGRSKWEQLEDLEMERKGETTQGRRIIRVVPSVDEARSPTQTLTASRLPTKPASQGPFKLLLEDFKGQTIYAMELRRVDKITMPGQGHPRTSMNIGCKILLRKGTKVARGMVLLEPKKVTVLGGKIDALDKTWKDGREARLRAAISEAEDG